MEDDHIFLLEEDNLIFAQLEDNLKKHNAT